eukprot:gene22869-30041_t
MDVFKEDHHSPKENHHHHDKLVGKDGRLERHSANGHSIKEQPKKGGAGGKGVWGTEQDDIKDALNPRISYDLTPGFDRRSIDTDHSVTQGQAMRAA